MPRIRKKTSRRGTTNQREKIKHKVSETRKKRKKDSKKVTQWKTKNPKDPGIPNNFPYKDQILAEVAEQRRQAEEEKQRRKEAKKAAKAAGDAVSEEDIPHPGILSLVTQATSSSSKTKDDKPLPSTHEEVPILMNSDFPNLKAVMDLADVVLEVLDARDPLTYRSSHLEEYVLQRGSGVKLAFVLNKIDTCPRESIQSWITTLRNDHPTFLFRSSSAFIPSPSLDSGKGKGKADDALGLESILAYLIKCSEVLGKDEPLVVAVVGPTNVGKSSFVNSLIKQTLLPIYTLSSTPKEGPTTTPYAQEVPLELSNQKFRVIDTPGFAWLANPEETLENSEKLRARDILTRSRGRIDRLKDPLPVVTEIISRANKEDLMLFYNIPAFSEGDVDGFLTAVARSNSLLKKGGAPDLTTASRIILRDWSTGRIPRYTIPAAAPPTQQSDAMESNDENVLATLIPRKELRKTSGLVKLQSGEVDKRKVGLEMDWVVEKDELKGENGDIDGEDEEEGVDEDEEGEEDASDEEEEEDDEQDDTLILSGKRKRKSTKQPLPTKPKKSVAFAVEPKRQKRQSLKTTTTTTTSKQTTQKPLKTKSTAMGGMKSSLKKSNAAKVVGKTPKVVNSSVSSSSGKGKAQVAVSTGGEEAYDFKKFF